MIIIVSSFYFKGAKISVKRLLPIKKDDANAPNGTAILKINATLSVILTNKLISHFSFLIPGPSGRRQCPAVFFMFTADVYKRQLEHFAPAFLKEIPTFLFLPTEKSHYLLSLIHI